MVDLSCKIVQPYLLLLVFLNQFMILFYRVVGFWIFDLQPRTLILLRGTRFYALILFPFFVVLCTICCSVSAASLRNIMERSG